MLKICLIYSFKPSAWVSCQKIVANLVKAYEELPGCELLHIHFNDDMVPYQQWEHGQKIFEFRPELVVFLDHKPHPLLFLQWVQSEFNERNHRPAYVFHLYGDFSLYFQQWETAGKLLKDEKVLWYAASPRQKAMLGEYIDPSTIHVCPFPVDPSEFYFDEKLRKSVRAEKNWNNGEMVFLFTGRLSRQKRIHQLITAFMDWKISTKAQAKLVLVGETDKIGEPWLFKGEHEGEYFHFLLDVMDTLPLEERKYIEFHGFVPNAELNAYYCAADALVNISVHNDEDYGMSCAEALAVGLPLVLTDWAGFAGFKLEAISHAVELVPVRLHPKGKKINLKAFKASLEKTYQNRKTFNRDQIAKKSLDWTSVKAASKKLIVQKNQISPFTAFTPVLEEAAWREQHYHRNTFTDMKKKTFNSLYMKVYDHYVR